MKSPVLFLIFNRPDQTRIVFEEIRKIRPTRLFIGADGPRATRVDDIENENHEPVESIMSNDAISLVASYESAEPESIKSADMGFSIHRDGTTLAVLYNSSQMGAALTNIARTGTFRLKLQDLPFTSGRYEVGLRVLANGIEADWPKSMVGSFHIHGSSQLGILTLNGQWSQS